MAFSAPGGVKALSAGQCIGQTQATSLAPSLRPLHRLAPSSATSSPARCSTGQAPRQRRWAPARAVAVPAAPPANLRPENVREATTRAEYDAEVASAAASDKLLVVEFTKESLPNAERARQALLELTDTTPDVVFLRALADLSPELRDACIEHDVTQIPSYVFFRDGRAVHKATGLKPERLRDEVLYYGQAEYPVRQLETVAELNSLLEEHAGTDRLVVVQVTLNFCGPCVKVYPAVLQMSHKMAGSVVFARLFGDANKETQQLVTEMKIFEAPTFLFYRNKELLGRYVGSGKGELVGEVLRYQGVQCT